MANLLGIIVTCITFPGVILHEWAHKFFCDMAGIPVYEVKYFRLGNPAGYVRHGEASRYRDVLLITLAPFIVNSLAALCTFIPAVTTADIAIRLAFVWLGVSFAMHAFPSDGDAKSMWASSWRMWRRNPLVLLGLPLVAVIMAANLLRIFWFDLIYAALLLLITIGLVGTVSTATL